jgi:hypothetical protein
MTPNLAIIHLDNPYWRPFWRRTRLWVPLFLLWIPFLLLAPFILLAVVIACGMGQVNPWKAIGTFWALLCALPGTDVHVRTQQNQVMVRIL